MIASRKNTLEYTDSSGFLGYWLPNNQISEVLEVNHPSRISKKKFYYDALEKIKTDNQW